MPYVMLAYSMLFAALSNAVCLNNAFFSAIDFNFKLYILNAQFVLSVATIRLK